MQRSRNVTGPADEVEKLSTRARVALRADDLRLADSLAEEALDIAVRSGDRRQEDCPLRILATVARLRGDHTRTRDVCLASIDLNESLGRTAKLISDYHTLALAELHLGNPSRADELLAISREKALQRRRESLVARFKITILQRFWR